MTPLARELVVRTGNVKGLRGLYRATYRYQSERVRRALAEVPGIAMALHRGATSTIRPGLSDIDLVIALDDTLSAEAELTAVERIFSTVRRVNLMAPLVRDVHVLRNDELTLFARVGQQLIALSRSGARPLVGRLELPRVEVPADSARALLLRDACYWLRSATNQLLYERFETGRRLAARSLARGLYLVEQTKKCVDDYDAAVLGMRSQADLPSASLVDWVALACRIDQALPDAPALDAESHSPHRGIEAAKRVADDTARRLAREPAVGSVVLCAEGPAEHDCRLYVAVDPEHARAHQALEKIAKLFRGGRALPSQMFTRERRPIVVTPRLLARTVFWHRTAFEPVARVRHGVELLGDSMKPCLTSAELRHAVLASVALAGPALRRLCASRARTMELSDMTVGLLPATAAYLRDGALETRPSASLLEGDSRRARIVALGDLRALVEQALASAGS